MPDDRDFLTGGLCPICGEHVTLQARRVYVGKYVANKTTDGRLIGMCGDAFTREEWESPEE